jgi:hypothetical protein
MFKQDKKLLAACVAAVGLWALLFASFVYPQWTAREEEVRTAQEKLDRLVSLTTRGPGTEAKPDADREVGKERAVLMEAINELKRIELGDLGRYKLSAAGTTDPRTHFAQLRRAIVESATQGQGTVRLGDRIKEDLGFGELAANDPASLNLVRLFAVSKFMDATKDAGVQEITALEYPAPMTLTRPETPALESKKTSGLGDRLLKAKTAQEAEDVLRDFEALGAGAAAALQDVKLPKDHPALPLVPKALAKMELERLVQLPLVVRVRADERAFTQLLYELQPSPTDPRFQNGAAPGRYFCVRGFHASVKDPKSTMLDATIQLGALFPESQMREQQVPIKEDNGPGLLRPPNQPW